MVNPLIGESLVVRIRGVWMAAEVVEVAGRNFKVRAVSGEVKDLVDTSHQTVQQKGWDLDRTAANRIANH